ncbi:MAG: HAMP domain-containing sensor histidine kinase [Pseudomonadota bacterium]|nr:HAMP domain-containing sensor histidine kinase [Pseudomonadota bacterium]
MNARNGLQVLLLVEEQTRSELALSELERTLGCLLQPLGGVEALSSQAATAAVALLEVTPANHGLLLKALQDEFVVQPYEHLILFQRQPGAVDLDPFWQCRLVLYVPVFSGFDGLYSALDQFFSQRRQISTLENQLREASDIAMLSMSASSQLGEIIRFLEKSYACNDYDQLGALLNQTLERLGVAGCGLIETDAGGVIYFGLEDRQDAWQRLMLEMRSKGRFVDLENRTIANFDTISVMARNMPEAGSEPYGRMKDMLFTLVEGAEARVKTLALERAVTLSEKAKSTFLRVMSHELRTPMNAILGFSSRLQAKMVGANSRERSAIQMIKDNAERLMEMIEDLEDLSSVSVDNQSARRKVLLEDVLCKVLRLAAEQAQAKGLRFISEFSEAGLQVELDPKRLAQVAKKLCLNAVKYTDHGEIRFSVTTRYDAQHGELVMISVQDTGQGMSEEKLQKLFRSVSQLYEDYVHHHQGTGLGITVVKEFVAEMEGTIEVTSQEGVGTSFKVLLPRHTDLPTGDSVELF